MDNSFNIAINYIKKNNLRLISKYNDKLEYLEIKLFNQINEQIGFASLMQNDNTIYEWYITIFIEEEHQKNYLSYIFINRLMFEFKNLIIYRKKIEFNNLITIGIDTDASGGFWERFMHIGRYSIDNEKRGYTNVRQYGFEKEIGALDMFNKFFGNKKKNENYFF